MYKLAIFDLDGTLLDTLGGLANSANYALEQNGFEIHEMDKYRMFVGAGIPKVIERMLPEKHRDQQTKDRVRAIFDQHYKEHNLEQPKPFEGMIEALQTLKQKGVHIAVLSNKPHELTQIMIDNVFENEVELTYGQREGVPIKPNPQGVEEVIDHFVVDKKECVYIGDMDIDMLVGKNAGIDTIGVAWGFREGKGLVEAGADYVIEEVSQLVEVITK